MRGHPQTKNQNLFPELHCLELERRDVLRSQTSPEVFCILLVIHTRDTPSEADAHKRSCLTCHCSTAKVLSQDIQQFFSLYLTGVNLDLPSSALCLQGSCPACSVLLQPMRCKFQRPEEHYHLSKLLCGFLLQAELLKPFLECLWLMDKTLKVPT